MNTNNELITDVIEDYEHSYASYLELLPMWEEVNRINRNEDVEGI